MKKALYAAMTMPLLVLSLHAEANLITLEAMKYYAEECAKQGGTSYVSNDQGTTSARAVSGANGDSGL